MLCYDQVGMSAMAGMDAQGLPLMSSCEVVSGLIACMGQGRIQGMDLDADTSILPVKQ